MSLRAGLVGCGRIGAFTRPELRDRLGPNWLPLSHAEALVVCDGVDLVACCDVSIDAAREAAAEHGVGACYSDYGEMLVAENLDVLAIATRSDVRPAIIDAVVQAGVRGIHSEKPLALSPGEALSAIGSMEAAGTRFSYGAVRRYMPVYARARRIAEAGDLGDVRAITIRFGRGRLLWTHPHSIDLLCYLAGDVPVAEVQASLVLDPGDVRDGVIDFDPVVLSATLLFANGLVGQIVPEGGLSVDIAGADAGISVLGDGACLLRRTYGLSRECRPETDWSFEPDPSEKSGRLLAIEDVRNAILEDRPATMTFSQVADQHRILFAMVASHLAGGRRVRLDEVDPDLRVTGRTGGLVA